MTTEAITPLRQRMIEDMNARKLCVGTQRGHIRACRRFAAFLKRSPDGATLEDIRRFQLHLADTGVSICTRNCIMTGLRFLFRVTLRRLDLAAEIYHLREPQKIPQVLSPDETRPQDTHSRTLAVSRNTLAWSETSAGLKSSIIFRAFAQTRWLEFGRLGGVCRVYEKRLSSRSPHSGAAASSPDQPGRSPKGTL
jgi:hypothetical protein